MAGHNPLNKHINGYKFIIFLYGFPAILLFGIAKSGLGGSIALISIPLMTVAMPLTQALRDYFTNINLL